MQETSETNHSTKPVQTLKAESASSAQSAGDGASTSSIARLTEELELARAQLHESRQRIASQAEELARLRLKLRFTESDRGLVRKDLATIYNARYWRILQRYWAVKRAGTGLLQGSLQGVKDLSRSVLPLSVQRWLARMKRRYGKAPNTLAAALGAVARADVWDDEPLPAAKFDIVCFPVIEWDFFFQRPQQLMTKLAQSGHRIFYISQQFRGSGKPFQITKRGENIYEVSLRGPLVNVYSGTLSEVAAAELQHSLNELRRDLGLGATLSLVQLPFWWPLAKALREQCAWPVLYDCMDFHTGFFTNQQAMQETETELLKQADQVVVSSQHLYDEFRSYNPSLSLIRNGCDYEYFAVAAERGSPSHRTRPQIGYYGTVAEWFDAELVERLAKSRPEWDFVIVGSTVSIDLGGLSRLPNVKLPGELPYAELPQWLQRMNVLLLPFRRLPIAEAANPPKVYEILAAGKPLVSVPLPEVVAMNAREEIVQIANTPEEFAQEIERALSVANAEIIESRRRFARQNTWQIRAEEFLPIASACFPKVSIAIVTYHNCDLNRECLQSLYERTEWPNFEVFVVDNASTDGTPEMLSEAAQRYTNLNLTLNQENLGFAKANNQALRQASGEYLVLLNNDTVITRGWLAGLVRHLAADEYLGLVGPVTNEIGNEAKIPVGYVGLADMPLWARHYVREHDNELFDPPMVAMFCIAIRRSIFNAIGELDERFGIGMFEDDDYTYRIRHAGLKAQVAHDVFIHHYGQAAFKLLPDERYRELFEENRRRYEEKWSEPWKPHQVRE